MANTQVNPTRMELTKQKKKLVSAVKGHKLINIEQRGILLTRKQVGAITFKR